MVNIDLYASVPRAVEAAITGVVTYLVRFVPILEIPLQLTALKLAIFLLVRSSSVLSLATSASVY